MTNFRAAPSKAPNPTMPVKTITLFNLTINAKTAKALEITIPLTMRTHRRSNRMNLQLLQPTGPVIALSRHLKFIQCQLCAASSTDRCNTFCELLSRRLIEQGLSRPFIELSGYRAKLGLAMQGQIGATRKILAQQSIGVFV